MQTLQQYLTKIGSTQAAFAARVGVSKGYVTELLNGSKRPSLGLAVRIEKATKGAVPATSWVPAEPVGMMSDGQSK